MSDSYTSIIAFGCTRDKQTLSNEIVEWLSERRIIKKDPSDCILSTKKLGYSVSDRANAIAREIPSGLQINGMEIVTAFQDFDYAGFEDNPVESDFGFVFWNWQDFSEEFIAEFKKRLGCEVVVIAGNI